MSIEEQIRLSANRLESDKELKFAGAVYDVEVDGVHYSGTITLTRAGQPTFLEMFVPGEPT